MADSDSMTIWNDLDSTLSSLDVITSRLAGMQNVNEEGEWSVSDTISDTSSHDTWYEALKLTSTGNSPSMAGDSGALHISPRSVVSEKQGSISSQSSSLGYHSSNQETNGALLSPLSENTKWTVSSPKSKVRFDELNLVLTKSPTSFDFTPEQMDELLDSMHSNQVNGRGRPAPKPTGKLKGIVKSKTTIPISSESSLHPQSPDGTVFLCSSFIGSAC